MCSFALQKAANRALKGRLLQAERRPFARRDVSVWLSTCYGTCSWFNLSLLLLVGIISYLCTWQGAKITQAACMACRPLPGISQEQNQEFSHGTYRQVIDRLLEECGRRVRRHSRMGVSADGRIRRGAVIVCMHGPVPFRRDARRAETDGENQGNVGRLSVQPARDACLPPPHSTRHLVCHAAACVHPFARFAVGTA